MVPLFVCIYKKTLKTLLIGFRVIFLTIHNFVPSKLHTDCIHTTTNQLALPFLAVSLPPLVKPSID